MAVALTGLRLPASKGTGLPFGSPASTTIDFGAKRYVWPCDGMTQKKTLLASVSPLTLSGVPIPAPVLLRCLISINRKCLKAQEVRFNVTSVVKKHNLLEQIFIH